MLFIYMTEVFLSLLQIVHKSWNLNVFILLGEKAHYRNIGNTTNDSAITATNRMAERYQNLLQQRISHTLQDFSVLYSF